MLFLPTHVILKVCWESQIIEYYLKLKLKKKKYLTEESNIVIPECDIRASSSHPGGYPNTLMR